MQPRTLLAALMVGLLAAQVTVAYYRNPDYPDPDPSVDFRDENRDKLIAAAPRPYNPVAPNTVTYGTVGNLVTITVPQSVAIEMHVDFLDKYDVRLADFGQDTTATRTHSTPPNATTPGEFWFQEWGYQSADALCPTLDPMSPEEYRAATSRDWPVAGENGQGQMPGVLRSEVSKHSVKGFLKQTNFLWRWDATDDPNPLTHPDPREPDGKADDEWRYGGPKNAGWDLTGVGFVDYYCRKDSSDNLFHNSWVEPLVYETGDPMGVNP